MSMFSSVVDSSRLPVLLPGRFVFLIIIIITGFKCFCRDDFTRHQNVK